MNTQTRDSENEIILRFDEIEQEAIEAVRTEADVAFDQGVQDALQRRGTNRFTKEKFPQLFRECYRSGHTKGGTIRNLEPKLVQLHLENNTSTGNFGISNMGESIKNSGSTTNNPREGESQMKLNQIKMDAADATNSSGGSAGQAPNTQVQVLPVPQPSMKKIIGWFCGGLTLGMIGGGAVAYAKGKKAGMAIKQELGKTE